MGAPGCDDAPIIRVPMTSTPKRVTLILPYYDNPDFLAQQVKHWWSFPGRLRERFRVIVVDDCSPTTPARAVLFGKALPVETRLFRVGVDVRWNWLAARNIGWRHATEGWGVMTDMDHVIPEETLDMLVHGAHDIGTIYRFSRIEHTGKEIHPHPNSWFMTREMFWKVGGYDEACSGYYGTDGDYRRRCAATAPIRIMTAHLERHEHMGDSSTVRYKRKQPEDAMAKQIMRKRGKGWKPRVLSFPYSEVSL